MCSKNDDPSTYDDEPKVLTISCPHCNYEADGLLDYENHRRKHEFGGEDSHLEMDFEDRVSGGFNDEL